MNLYPTLPVKQKAPMSQREFLALLNEGLQKPMFELDAAGVVLNKPLRNFAREALSIIEFAIFIGHPPKLEAFSHNFNSLLYWLAVGAGEEPWREFIC